MKLRLSLIDINTLNVYCFTNHFACSREFLRPIDTTLDNRDEGLDCNVTEIMHIVLHDLNEQRAGAGKSQKRRKKKKKSHGAQKERPIES